jgi:hypothetical integral membrane protein (TIGR02206 family)
MSTGFALFGPAHVVILAGVAALAAGFSWLGRRGPEWGRAVRFSLGIFLAANELVWYAYRLYHEGFRFPEAMPLHLCDLALWLSVIAALRANAAVWEVAYFAGAGGSTQALLTPELWAPLPSYPTIYFFAGHGMVVVTVITLVGARIVKPRPGAVWRALVWLNAYAAAVGIFNVVFGTNYMFLCRKPESASLLDFFGPWPVYIVVAELVAIALFWLLWLPFARGVRAGTRPGEPDRVSK